MEKLASDATCAGLAKAAGVPSNHKKFKADPAIWGIYAELIDRMFIITDSRIPSLFYVVGYSFSDGRLTVNTTMFVYQASDTTSSVMEARNGVLQTVGDKSFAIVGPDGSIQFYDRPGRMHSRLLRINGQLVSQFIDRKKIITNAWFEVEKDEVAARVAEWREQKQAAIERRKASSSSFWSGVATVLGGLNQGLAEAYADQQADSSRQQAVLDNIASQARAAEMQKARQQAAANAEAQRQRDAERAAQNAALTQKLAEAEAYRARQLATTTDPARRAELQRQSAGVAQIARQMGTSESLNEQTRNLLNESDASPRSTMPARRPVPSPVAPSKLKIVSNDKEFTATYDAGQPTSSPRPSSSPKSSAPATPSRSAPATTHADPGDVPPGYGDWRQVGSDDGVDFYYAYRVNSDEIRVVWACVNNNSEGRSCAVGTAQQNKVYRCYSGPQQVGQTGSLGERSRVGANSRYVFPSDWACRGLPANRVQADAVVAAYRD